MANVMHTKSRPAFSTRTSIQKVTIVLGVAFLLVGVAGIFMPGLMAMHLSMAHNLIHLATGALALSAGYSESSRKAFASAVVFGAIYGFLGIAGFIVGQPGYPGVGHMEADQYLFRIVPNVLEFGMMDHSIHLFLSAAFLFAAYSWKHSELDADRSLVDVQRRAEKEGTVGPGSEIAKSHFEDSNSASDLSKAPLGDSDIAPVSDRARRNEFENRP